MEKTLKPTRRVVAANDPDGKSYVVSDQNAPRVHTTPLHPSGHTDLWAWNETPSQLAEKYEEADLSYDFPGALNGGHLRLVETYARPIDYDPYKDDLIVPPHAPKMRPLGRTWDRGGKNSYSSNIHKTETIDYAVMIEGERHLVMDDCATVMRPGDVLVQVGSWQHWSSPGISGRMVFDLIGARFTDRPLHIPESCLRAAGKERSNEARSDATHTRRIVAIDKEDGSSTIIADGPSRDLRFDLARPGFVSERMWVTDCTPAVVAFDTLHLPHTIEPPPQGSVFRVMTFPPDSSWQGKVGVAEVTAYFQAMGSPHASTYSVSSKHPYMQKTRTLDFAVLIEGELVLILDKQEVIIKAGDVAVLRGTNHAWSNRTSRSAKIAIMSHDGKWVS